MKTAVALLLATTIVSGPLPAAAQEDFDAEAHFAGKELRLILPTNPGGDRALYALTFAPFFSKHIPGNPTVVPEFQPGAGGSVGLNYAYNVAEPDGLTLVTPLTSVLTAQLTGLESVQYDAAQFQWIGRIADATRVLVVTDAVEADDLEGLRNEEVIVGAVGRASETYANPALMNEIFGTKFNIISGYGGTANTVQAMMTGEAEGAFSTWNNIKTGQAEGIEDGSLRVLLQIALDPNPDLEGVPLLGDLAEAEEDRQLINMMATAALMGQSYAAPPETPAHIVEVLREAFMATMEDPEFVATMREGNVDFNPMGGDELEELVTSIMSTSPEVVARYQSLVGDE